MSVSLSKMKISVVSNQALSLDIGPTEVSRGIVTWKKDLRITANWKSLWRAAVGTNKAKLKEMMSTVSTRVNKNMLLDSLQSMCGHFKWDYTQPSTMEITIHGPLFDNFKRIWGTNARAMATVNFITLEQKNQAYNGMHYLGNVNQYCYSGSKNQRGLHQASSVIQTFNQESSTSKMLIILHNLCDGNEWELEEPLEDVYYYPDNVECSRTGAFAEDKNLNVPDNVQGIWSICRHGSYTLNIIASVVLEIEDAETVVDDCLPQDVSNKLSSTCENILSRKIKTDLSIVASNGSVLECHQCFLAVNSTVLAAMLDSNMQESRTSRIELVDVSEECVKALLEYLYTFKITQGRENSLLAVELFQVAHKYDIRQLEEELGKILLKRANSWYDVNAALELFRFARNVDEYQELKLKCVQVLQLKAEELLKSDSYKKLFNEDLTTAMELCAIALKR